jgi:hypothetical protein
MNKLYPSKYKGSKKHAKSKQEVTVISLAGAVSMLPQCTPMVEISLLVKADTDMLVGH